MPNLDNSPLWAIERHVADLEERIRSLEAGGGTDATAASKAATLRVERNALLRRRDLCIMRSLGADYMFSPGFTELWHQMTAGDTTIEPTSEEAPSDPQPRRRQA
jgi:hypothetical protein